MSIHAVDKKKIFFRWGGRLELIYFLVIWIRSKNRGILIIEIWETRKQFSVTTFGEYVSYLTICSTGPNARMGWAQNPSQSQV